MSNGQEAMKNSFFCNKCDRETSHSCHGEYSSHTSDYEFCGYRLYVCDKCEAGVLEVFYTNPDICDHAGGNWNEDDLQGEYLYFPERTQSTRRPQEITQAPKKLIEVYHEIITAFNAGAPRLCAIGIRALIEGICQDKQVPGNNLQKKIDGLDALTGQGIADGLHSIRFLGNTAAHKLEMPYKPEVELAIELCESVMVLLYSLKLEKKSKLLKETRDANAKQTDICSQFSAWTGRRGWK